MSEGTLNPMVNEQYGNVGDIGDILKHGALVELAGVMSGPGSRPVAYVETHAFTLRAPVANRERWQQEVAAELQAWPGYQRYFDREAPEVEEGNYRCSCGLALDVLPGAMLYLAEADPPTRAHLGEQLTAESITPVCLLTDAKSFAQFASSRERGPLLILVDPFDSPHAYWSAVGHLTSTLCGPQEAGMIEVFAADDQPIDWPEPPPGFFGPVATIDRAPFHLAVYTTSGSADQARSILSRLGWRAHAVS
jgi:hypothetical protein